MYYQADLLAALQTIPWFVDLHPKQLERLAGIASYCDVHTNEVIFSEGERIDFLYLILEGQIAIENFVPTRGWTRLFTAEPLDIIGWSSMTPVIRQRTATARALGNGRLIAFNADALRKACEEDHSLGYVILKRISNVVASRLLTTRLQLLELFTNQPEPEPAKHPLME